MLKDGAHTLASDNIPVAQVLSDCRSQFLGFLVRRLGNRQDAEDILQEFCIRVLARKDQLRDAERMDAWLFAILRSALNDHFRKTKRQSRLVEAVGKEPPQELQENLDETARFCTCATGLVSKLRPEDAELIRRLDFDNEDRVTVATELGISRNTMGVRLHRARKVLREALLDHCDPCCRTGHEDCYCSPQGCENSQHGSHC